MSIKNKQDEDFFIDILRCSYPGDSFATDRYFLDAVERLINNFGFDAKAMAERILQEDWLIIKHFWIIAYEWIRFYGRELPPERCDDRNRMAIEKCRVIASLDCFDALYDLWTREEVDALASAKNFVKQSFTMHRTLMQTFTKLIFAFIDSSWGSMKDAVYIAFEQDPDWWRLPLI